MSEYSGRVRKRIAVLGAGPSGLIAAYKLSKNPEFEVSVFESSEQVGGLAKSLYLWGQKVDLGPHRFYTNDSRILSLRDEVLGDSARTIHSVQKIYFDKRYYNYPLSILNVLRNLGLKKALLCFLSFIKTHVFKKVGDIKTFDEWVSQRFGKKMYEMFFKAYNEKLWGMPSERIEASFASQRLGDLSFWRILKMALGRAVKNMSRGTESTFVHPVGGSGDFYEKIQSKIVQAGSTVHLSRPVKGLWTDGKGNTLGIELLDGEFLGFDHVISTVPINKLISTIKEVPLNIREAAMGLKFRNTIIVYLEVQGTDLFKEQIIYAHDPALRSGRVTNFRNWSPEMCGHSSNTILAVEFWCGDEDVIWGQGDIDLLELAKKELATMGLLQERMVLNSEILRIPRCYPIYETGYREKLELVEKYIDSMTGVQAIGRYGSFKYNNQDHAILMGILAAENLENGKKHNLWKLHSDYLIHKNVEVSEEAA